MTQGRLLVITAVCTSFFAALTSDAVAKTGVAGDYRCKPYKARNALIPSVYGVKLKSNGRYAFTYYGANGGTTSGAFSRSGSKLTFSSGPLKGKTATFHGPGGSGLFKYKAELVFASFINDAGKQSCRR
jgi:hypothetical protein